MKKASMVAYVRRLCCSGMSSQYIMPELLPAIRQIIRADHSIFFWVDRSSEVTNVYPEYPIPREIGALYFTEYYNKRECDAWDGFTTSLRNERGVINVALRQTQRFFQSGLYNDIWKPLAMHHCLRVTLRDGNIPLGTLRLYRACDTSAFSCADALALTQLAPYLTHPLSAKPTFPVMAFAECADSGLVVLNSQGKMQYASPQGRRLLLLYGHGEICRRSLDRAAMDELTQRQLSDLCQRLVAIFADKLAPIPVIHRQNGWGRFKLEAYWLEQPAANSAGLIGVAIRREEPQRLKLLRCMNEVSLSPKQQEIALLLADDYTHSQIAEVLDVKPSTVISHVRALYSKLDVHSRTEMLAKFLHMHDEEYGDGGSTVRYPAL